MAGDREVERAARHISLVRVDDQLAVDAADADRADGTAPGNVGAGQSDGSAVDSQNVGGIFLVHGHDRGDHMHIVPHPVREERTDRAVGDAAAQNGGLGRTPLALDEAAGNLACRIITLLEIDEEREEVHAFARLLGHHRRHQDDRVSVPRQKGAISLFCNSSGFKGHSLAIKFKFKYLFQYFILLFSVFTLVKNNTKEPKWRNWNYS